MTSYLQRLRIEGSALSALDYASCLAIMVAKFMDIQAGGVGWGTQPQPSGKCPAVLNWYNNILSLHSLLGLSSYCMHHQPSPACELFTESRVVSMDPGMSSLIRSLDASRLYPINLICHNSRKNVLQTYQQLVEEKSDLLFSDNESVVDFWQCNFPGQGQSQD